MVGLVIGAGFFAELYPLLRKRVLARGPFPAVTVPEFLKLNLWMVIILTEAFMMGVLILPEYLGL
jgi:hypothetical protein